jgi:hypothetical protein
VDDEQMRVGVIGHPKIRIGGGSGQFNFLCSSAARRHFFQICTSLVESGRSSQKIASFAESLAQQQHSARAARVHLQDRSANSETLTPNA